MSASDHALVVGINSYSKLRTLRGAEADALAMRDWLAATRGGDVPEDQITTILSSDYPAPSHPTMARPMTDDIRAEIERLIDDAGPSLRLGRRLYLYLAGHGFAPSIDESALLMANASAATLHHLPGVRYANALRESTVFEEIVLIMDCCRDHVSRPPLIDLGLPPIAVDNADAAYFFAFATRWSLGSREGVDEFGQVRGHFTRAILEGLHRESATSKSVMAYVCGRLPELADHRGYFAPEFRSEKTIRFRTGARTTAPPACVVRVIFPEPRRGVTLRILDSDERIVAERPMETSPWSLTLPRGLYELLRTDQAASPRQFRVPATGTIDVSA
jgi:hypothetical protein